MNARTMSDALIAASAAAARWPRWKMGIDEVPGHIEPLRAAEKWMGVKTYDRKSKCSPLAAWIIRGYKDRYGSYYVDLWRSPWQLATNLRKWSYELSKPMRNTKRLAMAEALSEAMAILEMPDLPDGIAELASKVILAKVYRGVGGHEK